MVPRVNQHVADGKAAVVAATAEQVAANKEARVAKKAMDEAEKEAKSQEG
jgi:hypothetical protein